MKQVVSVSLGSASRDFEEEATFLGEPFTLRRVGTDGDYAKYNALLREWDGKADALCLGGIDRYVWSDGKQYEFKDARKLIEGVTKSPIVDGSGLKNTLERETIRVLADEKRVNFAQLKTLMVCGVDRFGMSEALVAQGGPVVFGDMMFSLGINLPIKTWKAHRFAARTLLPLLTQLPFKLLYPTGDSQTTTTPKWGEWYRWADVIAGDFLLIRRYLPDAVGEPLAGKTVITNTTTPVDRAELKQRGVRLLVTSTPRFGGRSPGTNVLEGVFVALNGGKPLTENGYQEMLARLSWAPNVEEL
ncbi:MAG: quinate 5-dehydrogenase [Akkermansiaceae bacterium]|nr:quinate 5-dehydrogenase [Armatimonadota bacterium]